jgi:hypothetical protein
MMLQDKAEDLPTHAPFWTHQVSLGMVVDGVFYASHTKEGKTRMLTELVPRAELIIATWHGRNRSDLFVLSPDRVRLELDGVGRG